MLHSQQLLVCLLPLLHYVYGGCLVQPDANGHVSAADLTAELMDVAIIGDNAFNGCTNLTSIEIPDSVTEIGYQAFRDTANLKSVDFSSATSLKTIGAKAFLFSGLTSVDLSNATSLEDIGGGFGACRSLTSVTLPSSMTEIGKSSFYGATALTSINLDHVTEIGGSAFMNTNLSSITILNPDTTFGSNAFRDVPIVQFCGSEIGGRENAPNVDQSTQEACVAGMAPVCLGGKWRTSSMPNWDDATKTLTINDGTAVIADNAYKDCTDIEAVVIPDSVETIGDYAFYNSGLMSKIFLNSDTTVGANSFPAGVFRLEQFGSLDALMESIFEVAPTGAILSHFSPQELKDVYLARQRCTI